MSFELWLLFAAAALALAVTPGPNGLLCLNHGARYGLGRAVFTALGSITGMTILIAASLAGLGALLLTSEFLFTVVKWVGAAYLIYLGVRLWFSRGFAHGDAGDAPAGAVPMTRAGAYSQGLAVSLSNPKALLFFATFLPQFMRPETPIGLQFVVFAATFGVIEFVYEVVIAGTAHRMFPWLQRWGVVFNRITGGAFVGVGATVAMSSR